jgi:hypothetical protein
MAVQAVVYSEHRGHFLGDVPVLLLYAAVLAWLTPKGEMRITSVKK